MGARISLAIPAIAVLGILVVLAALPSAGFDAVPPAAAQVRVEAVVQMLDALAFDPAVLVVQPGANLSLLLVNDGNLPHTFTLFSEANVSLPLDSESTFQAFYQNSDAIADVPLASGNQTWLNFTAPTAVGNYVYACVVSGHAVGGMHGVLVVGQTGDGGLVEPGGPEGVALRAYWIGLIGIFSMVAVIVVAYFVIKYESRHHTDHREHRRRELP